MTQKVDKIKPNYQPMKPPLTFRSYPLHAARHNPHPQVVRHFQGLNHMRICNVDDNQLPWMQNRPESSFSMVDPLKRLPDLHLRQIPYKEKAIPHFGMVRVGEAWRFQLMEFTEAVLRSVVETTGRFPAKQITDMHPVPVRRPLTSWLKSDTSESSIALTPPPQSNAVLRSQSALGHMKQNDSALFPDYSEEVNNNSESNAQFNVDSEPDFEAQVFRLLSQILCLKNFDSLQNWLVNSPIHEKLKVMEIVRDIMSSRAESKQALASIDENEEDDGHIIQTHTPSTHVDRLPVDERPVTALHSPYIYRPSSVASFVSSKSTSKGKTMLSPIMQSQGVAPVRLKYSSSGRSSSSCSFGGETWKKNRGINTSITASSG